MSTAGNPFSRGISDRLTPTDDRLEGVPPPSPDDYECYWLFGLAALFFGSILVFRPAELNSLTGLMSVLRELELMKSGLARRCLRDNRYGAHSLEARNRPWS